MKRRAEHLVEKRDGRNEWLRAAKLARSIHLALAAARVNEEWRAVDVAEAVYAGLRGRAGVPEHERPLRTLDIAEAVVQVLVANGFHDAAHAYVSVGAERRRRSALLALDRAGGGAAPDAGVASHARGALDPVSSRLR